MTCVTLPRALSDHLRVGVACAVLVSGGAALTGCGSEGGPTQLRVDSFVSTCATDSDDCDGRPAEGADVEVRRGGSTVVASGRLDGDGRIAFDLDPGEYTVVVSMGDLHTEPSSVMLSDGQTMSLTMPLPQATGSTDASTSP